MEARQRLMVIDDEESIRGVIAARLSRSGYECVGVGDGLKAVHALQADRFEAVIADVNMPYMRGTELLKWAKIADPDLPFIIISGNEDLDIVRRTLRDGAFDFLVKPLDLIVLESTVKRAIEEGLRARETRSQQLDLQRLVELKTKELGNVLAEIEKTYDATILALGSALETRDTETQTHGLRVAKYSILLARVLGMSDRQQLTDIERGAYLHDIGKIGVPDHILRKRGPLTASERAVIMRHPEIGMRMVAGIGFLKGATPIVYCHHERTDGTGYPRGLRGHEIPVEARVFSVADALDAMISERPYRLPMPLDEVRRVIDEGAGRQFDPVVTQALSRITDEEILRVARITDGEPPEPPPLA
jgi:putative nucleotidyltransferase with HDIG domain